MPDPDTSLRDAAAVRAAVADARAGLVDREVLADVVVLCAIAGEHVLVVGPPGTAKSEAIRRVARRLGESYYEYLIGRFTEPNEIFGPIDLRSLRDGVVRVETAGMLPEAEIAFLDEVFLGSTAILNALLGLLNERVYRRGSTVVKSPLRVCVGACNVLPEDPALAAFADRFLARVFVDPVPDERLEELLEIGRAGDAHRTEERPDSLAGALDRLAEAARAVDVGDVGILLATAIRRLRAAGVALSDRRAVRAQRLVAAAAVLDDRSVATPADLWVLPLIAPSADAQELAGTVLADLMTEAANRSLPHAAEAFSRGPAARAARMATAAGELLAELDVDPPADDRLRIEALLREIDASFAPDARPDELAVARSALIARLGDAVPEPAGS
ncbi:AAA domain-containing protein [Pimelobacter simplex]|uniref:AAA domain-containing protein n=1 Tax=Nocardioides simplex TaxID=2045 RepID=A0A7J5DX11_NOCSI|nr:AAA family ATPase [Pimelobacter simplex]KAB2810457.1 AAA domain-containing protein [Pimelobacter simplex]